jgi:hypothetical protein
MRLTSMGWFLALGIAANSDAEDNKTTDCPMHQQHTAEQTRPDSGESVDHFAAVNQRGDKAMGFSHEKTVHHFGLSRKGGFISAETADAADLASRKAIRQHFQHIAEAFSSGNFDLPMFIHEKTVPGVTAMKKLKAVIQYRLENVERGGRIVIFTENPEALRAVHQFLRFQIEDHRTGDSVSIAG